MIDGAHALGTIDLNLTELGADYYILNTHKWFCSPKGCAALYVKPELQDKVRALNVSHGYKSGFHAEHTFSGIDIISTHINSGHYCYFLYFSGLRDYSPILALQCCMNFFNAIGPEVIRNQMHSLLTDAVELLTTAWKSGVLAPLEMCSK